MKWSEEYLKSMGCPDPPKNVSVGRLLGPWAPEDAHEFMCRIAELQVRAVISTDSVAGSA